MKALAGKYNEITNSGYHITIPEYLRKQDPYPTTFGHLSQDPNQSFEEQDDERVVDCDPRKFQTLSI